MFETNEKGILYFDGCSTVDLAQKYNTPLYTVSQSYIEKKCNEIKESFLDKYENTRAAYAGKAFLPIAMCKIIEKQGLGLDVVSGGELFTAIKAGFPVELIEFNGNNKTLDELELALEHNIGRIIIDNVAEIYLLEDLCKAKNKKINVLYRITPGVKSDTHDYITTGKKDSKFGIPLDDNIIYPAIKKGIESNYLNFMGFHFHVGSQLLDNRSHLAAVETSLALIKKTKDKFNYVTPELNIGGGFGIKYTEKDNEKSYSYFLDPIMERIINFCSENDIERPTVVIEPGRSIIGEAGITLYKVGTIKEIPGIRNYVSVDGGMTDNIRPALYQAEYEAVIANKADKEKDYIATICGKCCETGDILIKNAKIATPERDDIIAVFSTGAYGYSLANHYNKNIIPSVVLVKNGVSEVIVKRETYEDLIKNEVIPKNLL